MNIPGTSRANGPEAGRCGFFSLSSRCPDNFRARWAGLWCGNPPGAVLFFTAFLTAAVMTVPVFYVAWRSLFAGWDRWLRLLDTRMPGLLWNTMSMAAAVTFCALLTGVSLAWLVHRCDLPGRKVWQWLLALPLVIPPYIGAVAYIIILGPRGWLGAVWKSPPFNIYSFWGVMFVLAMFTFPYVFLVCGSALKRMNRHFEDAARSQGLGSLEVFLKVSLPLLRPAIGAGAVLISLYVLSDFGAVAMLRYNTFTAAIYYQMESYDTVSAAVLSFMLIFLTIAVLWIENKTRKNTKYYQTSGSFRRTEIIKLNRWKLPALGFVSVVFLLSVIMPVLVLVYWSGQGIAAGALDSRFWLFASNSVKVAGLASLACMVLALPVIYLKSRHPAPVTAAIDKLCYSGYALPGVIIAMGIIFIFARYLPWWYNTFALLPAAYAIRFLPQAMQSGEASLSLISPRIDETARSLGCPPWKVMSRVIIPLVFPGLLTGGAMVFVSSIKELPATLLLRPPGFDTLSVRIWVEASEAVYHAAAPAALLIIILSIIPLKWMLNRY